MNLVYRCTFGFTMRHIGNISVYIGCTMARTEYKTGTLPYICGKSVKPLGYAKCTPVRQNGSIFLIILFSFALILADCEFIAKLKKKNGVTA